MLEIVGTSEFETWYRSLADDRAEAVTAALDLLESAGADQPGVTKVDVHPKLNVRIELPLYELRVRDTPLRVYFVVEKDERAVVLYGYDAATESADRSLPALAHHVLAAKVYWHYRGHDTSKPR